MAVFPAPPSRSANPTREVAPFGNFLSLLLESPSSPGPPRNCHFYQWETSEQPPKLCLRRSSV